MAIGPSTSIAPYILGYEPNVHFTSVATVGDVLDTKADGTPYRMVGIPDGLGAFDNGDGTFTLLMNHELSSALGVVRDHGTAGSFVSQWVINKADLSVLSVEDAIKSVWLYDDISGTFQQSAYAINRLCSADLAPQSAYYWIDPSDGTAYGTQSRIFMTGEEGGTEGKEFALFVDGPDAGKAFEFADAGLFAWENNLASPFAQKKTITIGQDDGQNGQLYIYVGDKQATGTEFEKAGLEGGKLYGLKVEALVNALTPALSNETDAVAASGRFSLFDEGAVSSLTGAQLDAQSEANGVTSFQRPEDGHWDTTNPNVYWFVTTASSSGQSRLYKMTFDDITHPEQGGTIEAVLSSSDAVMNSSVGVRMMDNMTVNGDGKIIIQEDIGNNAHLGRILEYDPVTDTVTVLGVHNADQFISGGADFITQDEEASGIIDVTDLLGYTGGRAYITSDQLHASAGDAELVEKGQLLIMYVDEVQSEGSKDDDVLNGSAADEYFNGEAGNDIINAGSGDDSLNGGKGDDTLNGGAGNDALNGGNGQDILNGGAGDDTLDGGHGDDILNGGLGIDLFNGGAGADTFVFDVMDSLFAAQDKIQGFSSAQGDKIDLTAFHITAADLVITHGQGNAYVAAVDLDHDGSFDFGLTVITKAPLGVADFVL